MRQPGLLGELSSLDRRAYDAREGLEKLPLVGGSQPIGIVRGHEAQNTHASAGPLERYEEGPRRRERVGADAGGPLMHPYPLRKIAIRVITTESVEVRVRKREHVPLRRQEHGDGSVENVVHVLRGSREERVERLCYRELSTDGIETDRTTLPVARAACLIS